MPAQAEIEKGDTDMTEVLEQFAVAGPDAIFFPLFITEGSAFAAQARDATTILLSAIEAVAVEDGDRLHIDRAALRKQVGATAMSGLVGTLSCDRFGDCGTGRMNIYHHTDRSVTDVSKLPVVYVYSP